jgi:hypothetical protein
MSAENQEQVQEVRKITLYSTKTGVKDNLMSTATTYGQLKKEIKNLGIDADKFKATETTNKVRFEIDEAVLPISAFYLILTPIDTKSGADYPLDRKELFAAIKEAITAQPELKNKLGGNVTQMKTPVLEAFHKKHIAGKTFEPALADPKKAIKETPAKEVAKVEKVSKTESENIAKAIPNSEKSVVYPDPVVNKDEEETDMLAGMAKRLFGK